MTRVTLQNRKRFKDERGLRDKGDRVSIRNGYPNTESRREKRSERDSNPRANFRQLHDFQSCSLDQLGHHSTPTRAFPRSRVVLYKKYARLSRKKAFCPRIPTLSAYSLLSLCLALGSRREILVRVVTPKGRQSRIICISLI